MTPPDFRAAAERFPEREWLGRPLVHDSSGYPKRPIITGWPTLARSEETIGTMPWSQAEGIGIVLGLPSGGLCVMDIDGETLFNDILTALGEDCPRAVRTVRRRGPSLLHRDRTAVPGGLA